MMTTSLREELREHTLRTAGCHIEAPGRKLGHKGGREERWGGNWSSAKTTSEEVQIMDQYSHPK